jgi:hypothetical protein
MIGEPERANEADAEAGRPNSSIAGTVAFTSILGQDWNAPILAMLLCVVQRGHDSIAHGVPIFTAAQSVTPALIVNSQNSPR